MKQVNRNKLLDDAGKEIDRAGNRLEGLSPEEAQQKSENDPEIQRIATRIVEDYDQIRFIERYPELARILKTQREISLMEIPESEPMIAKGYKIAIIGEMQSGKSLLALRLGQDLVEGIPILDYFPWDKKWRVLYVNFELPEDEMIARFSLFGSNPDYVLVNLPIMALEEDPAPIAAILTAYREIGKPFDAVILDPKASCFGGDENQTQDTIHWCAACDELARPDSLCLIIPHHFGVTTTRKGGRGNTTFGAWLTKRLSLKGSDGGTRKTLAIHGKVGEPLALTMELHYPVWKVAEQNIATKRSKIAEARAFILEHIPEDRTPLIRMASQAGITSSIFKETQKQLESEGLIRLEQIQGRQGNYKRLIPTTTPSILSAF